MYVIGYIRVSTDQQVESGLGLEAQEHAIHSWIKKNNATLVEIYRDNGLSGALGLDKRPGMLQAISAASKNAILLVAKRDRLGRDPMVLAMIESAIKRKGARIISVAGEGTENDDPSNILMRRLIDAFGEYERLIIGARTKVALKAKKDKGQRVGHIPFGKKLSEDGIHLEIDPNELNALNKIYELRSKKLSIRTIASLLNDTGQFNRYNARWNHSSINRMLKK